MQCGKILHLLHDEFVPFNYSLLLLIEVKKTVDVLTIHLYPCEREFNDHEKYTSIEQEALVVLAEYCVKEKSMIRGIWSSLDLVDCWWIKT